MLRRSLPLPLVLLLLSSLPFSLSACSSVPRAPGPPPQVLKCQPPAISQKLLKPPEVGAINRLLSSLGMSPIQLLNAKTPSSASIGSK